VSWFLSTAPLFLMRSITPATCRRSDYQGTQPARLLHDVAELTGAP
jgi:hypothetical protein